MKIKVKIKDKIIKIEDLTNDNLLNILRTNNISVPADCGGNGTCGKCKARLLSGEIFGNIENGEINLCKSVAKTDIEIEIKERIAIKGLDIYDDIISSHAFSVALDMGTTTLEFNLVDVTGKKVVAYFRCLNPQSVYGADVISRISAVNNGQGEGMARVIRNQIEMVFTIFKRLGAVEIDELVFCGNTAMEYIFLGLPVKEIGEYPYIPSEKLKSVYAGESFGLSCKKVIPMPVSSGFIGGDVVCGLLDFDYTKNNLYIDLGTNGEIVLATNKGLFSTTTSAGPCLEGGNIECGIGGVLGGISKVENGADKFKIETIGNEKPIGICGSGLIDAVAVLLENRLLDFSGRLEDEKIYLTENVYLSQRDIRQFQLLKGAVYSAVKCILTACGIKFEDVNKVYIAGLLGKYINLENAVKIGVFDKKLKGKFVTLGSNALRCVTEVLLNKGYLSVLEKIAGEIKEISLSNLENFGKEFMSSLNFTGA